VAQTERPGLPEALEFLRKGDSLVVWRLDRLVRSLKHLLESASKVEEQGIGFRSLQESIDTKTSSGRLIFHIFRLLAKFEPNLIRERTLTGLRTARARGRMGRVLKKRPDLLTILPVFRWISNECSASSPIAGLLKGILYFCTKDNIRLLCSSVPMHPLPPRNRQHDPYATNTQ
jgi:DNA invertase Pin-like site-specific DNA recombinase